MEKYIMVLIGVLGLLNGLVIIVRPNWFKKLWKIRTSYEFLGSKYSNFYYTTLESVLIVMLQAFSACVANWRYRPYFHWIMWCARSRELDGDNDLTIRRFVRQPSGEGALETL